MLKIEVTQKDIDEGKPQNCRMCPTALASLRVAKPLGYSHVEVFLWSIAFVKDITEQDLVREVGADYVARGLPDVAARFIEKFDALTLDEIHPFSFEIGDLPPC